MHNGTFNSQCVYCNLILCGQTNLHITILKFSHSKPHINPSYRRPNSNCRFKFITFWI